MSDRVHLRAVMESVLPVIQARTAGLRSELQKSRQLRARADQARASLVASRRALADRRAQLRQLEVRKRVASRALTSHANLEADRAIRSEAHTSELQSLMRNPYAAFCLKKKHTLT